jgi:uncharacterized YigZ family protein
LDSGDTYITLKGRSEGFYKEKGSKFHSFAFIVNNESEIKKYLAELKKLYYDARHHCYAYVLGNHGDQYRANDDGEPGHSAGDPILGQIRSNNLTNTLIVVVRYFGGTKLGVSGLINAYKTAAADALANNSVVEHLILTEIKVQFDYPQLNQVMLLVKEFDLKIINQKMEMSCDMTLGVRLSLEQSFREKLEDFHEIKVIIDTDEDLL